MSLNLIGDYMNDSMFNAFFLNPNSEHYDAEYAASVFKAIDRAKEAELHRKLAQDQMKKNLDQVSNIQETLDSSFTIENCYDTLSSSKSERCLVVDADQQNVILCYND